MDDQEDLRILRSFMADEPGSVDAFMERYEPIFNAALRDLNLKNSYLTREDLLQEVKMYVFKKRRVIVGRWLEKHSAPFEGYLFKICRFRALKLIKSKKPPPPEMIDADEDPIRKALDHSEALLRAIDSMSAKDQVFIRLSFFCKRSVNELKTIFNMPSENAVSTKKNRILRKLGEKTRHFYRLIGKRDESDLMPPELLELDGISNKTSITAIIDAWYQLHPAERKFLIDFYRPKNVASSLPDETLLPRKNRIEQKLIRIIIGRSKGNPHE